MAAQDVGRLPDSEGAGRVEEVVVTGQRTASSSSAQLVPAAASPPASPEIGIEAAPWDPKRPYIDALAAAKPQDWARVFREQEAKYGDLPAFYFDVAEHLYRKGEPKAAAAMALNALELPTSDLTTLTVLADRLMRYGDEDRAIWVYEKVLYLDPDRPQPRRSLALALIERAERTAARGGPAEAQKRDYERAMALLNEVVTREWDSAYEGFEIVALMEANRIVPRMKALGVQAIPLDPRLVDLFDVDLRVVLEWNTDATDMDLWVDDPFSERAIFSHQRTTIGGRLSHDMTQGYGPEEFLLRRAPGGNYTVRVNVYRPDQLNPNGATAIRVRLYRDWGRPTQKVETVEVELKPDEEGARLIGTFKVGKPDRKP
jgi:hypothetical protein